MKHIKRRWLGLASALVLAGIGYVSPAYAINYTCDGGTNPVPANVTGTVNINLVGENCVIDHDVTATGGIFIATNGSSGLGSITTKKLTAEKGEVHLTAPNNAIDTEELKSGWHVEIVAHSIDVDGSITAQTAQLDSNKFPGDPYFHANILIRSQTNVRIAGDLRIDGGLGFSAVKSGAIQVDANLAGGNTEFVIGGSGANGISGSVITETSIGVGNDSYTFQGGLRITNGDLSSTGGIKIIDLAKIRVKATQSRAGMINLNAQNGTLTIPSGIMDARGTGLYGGGTIYLGAKTIEADSNTVLDTSQDADADPTYRGISIAAETVKFKGEDGLQILSDGKSLPYIKQIRTGPLRSTIILSSNNVNQTTWTIQFNGPVGTAAFEGEDSAPLVMRADGDSTEIGVYGYPLQFSGGDVSIRTRAASEHSIELGYPGIAAAELPGLSIDIDGDFLVDTIGDDGNGGKIVINADQSSVKATNITINASGPTSGDGDSGTISWKTSTFALDPNSKFAFKADAASSGTGNSVNGAVSAILFDPGTGELALGTEEGQINFSARGGSTSGNAGKIKLKDVPSAITIFGAIANAAVIDVSVPGTSGNGGVIDIKADGGLTFDSANSYLTADAGSLSGDAGKIIIAVTGDIVQIGDVVPNAVELSAQSPTDGKGGVIDIQSSIGIVANGAKINVSAGGDKKGGTISLTASGGELNLDGTFTANGGTGGGDGGAINLIGDAIAFPDGSNAALVASGQGTGKGGDISVRANNGGNIYNGNGVGELRIEASSLDSGDGGTIDLIADGEMRLYGAAINVNGGPFGDVNGGTLTAKTNTLQIDLIGDIQSSGTNFGSGGTVSLDSATTLNLVGATVTAPGGASGTGGSVLLKSAEATTLDDQSEVSANGGQDNDSDGGTVEITAADFVSEGRLKVNGYNAGSGGYLTVTTSGDITISGITEANGGCQEGDGGDITLEGNDVTTLSTLDANSGGDFCLAFAPRQKQNSVQNAAAKTPRPKVGRGGNTTIKANDKWVNDGQTEIHNDGTGSVGGGRVKITVTSQLGVYLNDLAEDAITAKGGNTGPGGRIEVNLVQPFDVNTLMKVDSGADITDNSVFGGWISLNGEKCQRQLTLDYDWPKFYWNCVSPEPGVETVTDAIPASVANSLLPTPIATLTTINPKLYVMVDPAQFTKFFGIPLDSTIAGYSFWYDNDEKKPHIAIFENTTLPVLGYTSMSQKWLGETTVHELAHSIDAQFNRPSLSQAFVDAMQADADYLDTAGGGLPCAAGTGPLQGIIDLQTRAPFCTGTTLNNPNNIYNGLSTSEIIRVSSQNLSEISLNGTPGLFEPYAHSMMYSAFLDGLPGYPTDYYDTTAGGLLHNGYLQCIRAFTAARVGKVYTPTYTCP